MNNNDDIYLTHILDAITKIEEYVKKIYVQQFLANSLIKEGVIRQIEIIEKKKKNLSPKFKNRYPIVPWKDIAGMRDKLIHDYLGVDLVAVWDTVKKDIPFLKSNVKKIVRESHNYKRK